ncbi:MAG: Gfo/Idh/MocA family protein [Verrucomicrobiales bacterium]
MKTEVVLIGVSGFARTHLQMALTAHERGEVRLAAVTIVNPEEEQEICATLRGLGCTIFGDYLEMLDAMAGRAQLCLIPTGISWHAPMTIAALERGFHVFVEKPAAATVDEVEDMMEASRRHDRWVEVGFQSLYGSERQEIEGLLASGALGAWQRMVATALWPRKTDYYQRNNWAGQLKVGEKWVLDSPMMNALAHPLNMMLHLARQTHGSEPDRLRAELYRARAIPSTDTLYLEAEYSSGLKLEFGVTHACGETQNPMLIIEGNRGRLVWNFLREWQIEDHDSQITAKGSNQDELGVRESIMAHLVARVGNPSLQAVSSLEHAGKHVRMVNAAHLSTKIQPIAEAHAALNVKSTVVEIKHISEALNGVLNGQGGFFQQRTPWSSEPGEWVPFDGWSSFDVSAEDL